MNRRTYSAITNLCLVLSLMAAFGFDRNAHPAWLVLAGCAAALAIATYFIRHWRRTRSAEGDPPFQAAIPVTGWTTERYSRVDPTPLVLLARTHAVSQKPVLDRQDVLPALAPGKSPSSDPADLAARVAGELLRSKHKPRELVIAPRADGSISIRFSSRHAEPIALPSLAHANPKVSETVH